VTDSSTAHECAGVTLRSYEPTDAQQRALRDDYLHLLDMRPDALQRSCVPDHLTASAIVLSPDGEQVLLHLHGKVHRWLQFGGHIEPGDTDLAAAALRESVEESGISAQRLWSTRPLRLDRHAAPCAPGSAKYHLDVQFLAVTSRNAVPAVSAESHDVRWFSVDALPESTDASVRVLVASAVTVLTSADQG
jgi:8-oxo-dGTP pyrophosphatase MutT (NUDIX family)